MIPDFRVAITESGWEASARIPGLKSGDLEITLEGNKMRVLSKQHNSMDLLECLIEVPTGFDEGKAHAAYLNGELRIVMPKLCRLRHSAGRND